MSARHGLSLEEAIAADHAYLSESVKWWRWKAEEAVRDSKEFRDLKVVDFRRTAARESRDRRLAMRSVSFLHEAVRYRGKASYRDAVFLGYGTAVAGQLNGYVDDLSAVLTAFVAMAGSFCARRLGPAVWDEFVTDLEAKRSFTTVPSVVWS